MTDSEDSPNVAEGWDGPQPLPARLRVIASDPQVRYPIVVLIYLMVIGSVFNASLESLGETLQTIEELTAQSVHVFVKAFTDLTTQHGSFVTLDGFAVSIIIECVGLLEMLIYSACVLAFPAPIRTRAYGVVLGCLAIYAFNVLRIVTLLIVGRHFEDYFDFFHIYFWQATLIAMIVSVLYGWIRLFVHR